MPVVARHPGHHKLRIEPLDVIEELLGCAIAQRRSVTPVVTDLDLRAAPDELESAR